MATLIATPNPARVGQSIAFFGEGFAVSTATVIRVDAIGWAGEIVTDAGGLLSNDDINDHADGVLTNTGNPANLDTVTIGSVTYRFVTALAQANDVLIGGSASASFDNLKAAINGATGAGTTYHAGTVAHPTAIAGAKTATTLAVVARSAGTDGNAIASTDGSTVLSWGAGTLVGGAGDPTGFKSVDWTPMHEGTYLVTASDGTNSASVKVRVIASS